MGIKSFRVMELYCDACATATSPEPWDELPHTFIGRNEKCCFEAARDHGWYVSESVGVALCPKHHNRRKPVKWTADEDKLLTDLWLDKNNLSCTAIAAVLGRSRCSIIGRARRLNLRSKASYSNGYVRQKAADGCLRKFMEYPALSKV